MEKHNDSNSHTEMDHDNTYFKLTIMVVLSFVAMYVLMYAMVDSFANVIVNINQFYMAGLMTMPMILIELTVMKKMYKRKKLNGLILGTSIVLLVGFYACIRQQATVTDKQFLKSMIPHHAAAILMVEKAKLQDPEVVQLGKNIIEAQQREIEEMKGKIRELESK